MNTAAGPVESYLWTFESLRARKRWSTNTATFRFVALTLGAAGATIGFDSLEQAASELRQRTRWSSPLKSEIRYVVAAMILRRGLDPAVIHPRVCETRTAFKAHKIPSRGTGSTLAALLLALQREGRPVPEQQLERLARIYRRWRKDHVWLTDANDLPSAALHAGRDESVEMLTRNAELAYVKPRDMGRRRETPCSLSRTCWPWTRGARPPGCNGSATPPSGCGQRENALDRAVMMKSPCWR